jgi:hypothetical protein
MPFSENKPCSAKYRVFAIFDRANHSNGMGQMLVITVEVAKL